MVGTVWTFCNELLGCSMQITQKNVDAGGKQENFGKFCKYNIMMVNFPRRDEKECIKMKMAAHGIQYHCYYWLREAANLNLRNR